MKRTSSGVPVMMVHRWNRPPLTCQPCREKKRRCDRNQPCSNCALRDIRCEYAGESSSHGSTTDSNMSEVPFPNVEPGRSVTTSLPAPATLQVESESLNTQEMLSRLRKLEEAVFHTQNKSLLSAPPTGTQPEEGASHTGGFIHFGRHNINPSVDKSISDVAYMKQAAAQLPPLGQARELFSHFAGTLQPTAGVLHIPSTRDLLEQAYETIRRGEDLEISSVLLLFSVFAGAALVWTPQLLTKLSCTQTEAKGSFKAYTRLAISILDNAHRPVPPSTNALAAISNLAHVIVNSDGYPVKIHVLHTRCMMMARAMQVHRLDTAKSRQERVLNGCNMIEVEVQRRVWWNMVASDWLNAFSGGPLEGAYVFHPDHMNVKYPSNVHDEVITPTMEDRDFPLSEPSPLSVFIHRIHLADLCRQVVDTMPSVFLESEEPDYDVVLALDEKFQTYLRQLPDFLKLDPDSIIKSQELCKDLPNLAWQRIHAHFSLHSRLCRLHRPFHLEGSANPKYAYSHQTCIRSAQTVLELRLAMDTVSAPVGYKPDRFWTVMQHVFLAALTLATDVSFNPDSPHAEARKAKVLAAYRTLEKSKEDSSALTEGIQRNMQTLMSTVQKQRPQMPRPQSRERTAVENSHARSSRTRSHKLTSHDFGASTMVDRDDGEISIQAEPPISTSDELQNSGTMGEEELGEEGWDLLWSEFLTVAPELDVPQWSSLLNDMDFSTDL